MTSTYAGADWIKEALGKELSPLGQVVADLLGDVYEGIYHIQKSVMKVDWTDCHFIEVIVNGPIATVDNNHLTRLLVLCHDRLLRCEVTGAGNGRLRLAFWQRAKREGRLWERCPSLEDHVADIRAHYVTQQPAAAVAEVQL